MKILKLTYNEILKQIKKKSFIICLAILLFFAIALPLLYKAFAYNQVSNDLYTSYDIENQQELIIKNPKTSEDKLFNKLIDEKVEIIKTAISKKEQTSEFKTTLYETYITKKLNTIVLEDMINNEKIDYDNIDETFYLATTNYKNLSKKELIKEQQKENKDIKELEQVIKNNDYTWYLNYTKLSLDLNTETSKKTKALIDEMLTLNIKNEKDSRINEANKIIDYYNQKEIIMSQNDYKKLDTKISYKDYVKITKEKNKELDNKIAQSYYALRNNIQYSNNAKDTFKDIINSDISVISLIIVVIAGTIVSSEFSKGTIRLLVIRPNKRFKILLSKFLAIVALTIIFGLIAYTATIITCGLAFGFKNLLTSDLALVGTQVVKQSFIINTLKSTFIMLIPVLFIGTISFFLSTITKSTALSVGLSIFILMGNTLAIAILSLIKFPFIELTFLPYLDFSQFLSINKLDLINNYEMYQIYYTFKKAILVITTWAIILYLISNLVFCKKDIKN